MVHSKITSSNLN